MDELTGSVERITFYNAENGYSVVRLRPDGVHAANRAALSREGLVTLTGNLPELSPGEHIHLQGRWTNHAKHGMQFQVEFCKQTLPATTAGIRRYLGSGLIKGIGPRLAERIVKAFGAHTLEVIEQHPERLLQVQDIGPKRSGQIAKAWAEQKQVKEIMLFLHSHGVSTNLAIKIYKEYGDNALQVVQGNPYRLARDIRGVGFKTADKIAQALGLSTDHPSRVEAGLVYALNEMSDDGHVYAPREILAERAAELLGVPPDLIPPALDRLAQDDLIRLDWIADAGGRAVGAALAAAPAGPTMKAGQGENAGVSSRATARVAPTSPPGAQAPKRPSAPPQVSEPSPAYTHASILPPGHPAVYLTPLYHGETHVADRLRTLAAARTPLMAQAPRLAVSDASLSPEQLGAVRAALEHPLSVLTGGPGTGKTTAVKALIAALESGKKRYALASPTGRAAKRLSEATGRPASTIHRLLGPSPSQGFKFNAQNTLPIDFMVLDEVSMLDLLLANHLLKALQPGTHLLLVGDVDQLPSVGAGDVLRDVIASGLAPVTHLNVIFRQAADSFIITNAHRINKGQMPLFPANSPAAGEGAGGAGQDFFLFPAETPEEAANWVEQVVCDRIPRKFGLDPLRDIQILAPMYRGAVGVNALNARLQAVLNPPGPKKPEKALFGQLFRPGDKVMQTQNNYDKDVYNGDIGSLVGLDLIEHTLAVEFDGRPVTYDFSEADQLVLAYSISIHKSQGSEFPAVVIPLVTQHYMMLQRNLVYTAITRAKTLCVLVGSRRAIGMAVRNDKVAHRYTALDRRLAR